MALAMALATDMAMGRQQQAMAVAMAIARQLIFMIYFMHWILLMSFIKNPVVVLEPPD